MANQLLLILMWNRHSDLNRIILNGVMQLKQASSGPRAKMFRFHWAFFDLARDKSLVWWFWVLQKAVLQADLKEWMGLRACVGYRWLVWPWGRGGGWTKAPQSTGGVLTLLDQDFCSPGPFPLPCWRLAQWQQHKWQFHMVPHSRCHAGEFPTLMLSWRDLAFTILLQNSLSGAPSAYRAPCTCRSVITN